MMVYVGEIEPYVPTIDGCVVAERLFEEAYDELGECAESWLEGCKNEDYDKLSDMLTNTLNEWIKETHNEPNFYHIGNIQTFYIG